MLKIFICTLAISFILSFLPERFWTFLSDRFEYWWHKILGHVSLKNGQGLLKLLTQIEMELLTKGSLGRYELLQYKFYTSLTERVLDYARRFGSPLRTTILELREALLKDLQFENKIRKEFWGGLAQFILIALVTWVFVGLSVGLLELHLAFSTVALMIFLQCGGILSYFFLFYFLRQKNFRYFDQIYSAFYGLLILAEAGLSVRLSLQESGIVETLAIKDKRFFFLFSRGRDLLERWQSKGIPLKGELKELLAQSKALEEAAFESFLKTLSVGKFIILCLGFLSAYFVYLFSLFHVFLIE